MSLPVLFFFTTVLANLDPLPFHINFKISSLEPARSAAGTGSVLTCRLLQGLGFLGCCSCIVLPSCLTLCDPRDGSPPGSSVRGVLQARILERGAISLSRGSSRPREGTQVSRIAGRFFTAEPPGQPIGAASGEESTGQCRRRQRCGFDPWVGKIPWSRKSHPTPEFLPGTGDYCHLNSIMSLQQEHGLSFHLFRSSFSTDFVWRVRNLHFFFKNILIPKYIILFDAIISEIVFLISFSECSLLVYRNTIDFCV